MSDSKDKSDKPNLTVVPLTAKKAKPKGEQAFVQQLLEIMQQLNRDENISFLAVIAAIDDEELVVSMAGEASTFSAIGALSLGFEQLKKDLTAEIPDA